MTTTSINDLPYDILYIIFALCWDKIYSRTELSFPTIASHVCRKWREHALDTPAFWSNFNFQDYTPQLEKHQTWLQRSRDYPLDIVLGGYLFNRRSIKTVKEILRLIVPCSDRWRTLKIYSLPDKVIRVIFDRLLDIPMPSLIDLEVVGDHTKFFHTGHKPAPTKWRFRPFLLGGAPKLRSIVLEGWSCDYVSSRFTSLRVLDVRDAEVGIERPSIVALKVHHLLSRLPHLQSLRLRSFGSYPRRTDRNNTQAIGSYITPPLTHCSLNELSISAPAKIRNVVISSLVLPEARYFVDRTRWPPHELEIGLGICCLPVIATTRPFPNLVSLRLTGSSVRFYSTMSVPRDTRNSNNLHHLQGALEGLPMLRSLTLDRVDLESGVQLNCLSKTCPVLQWLSVGCCTGYTLVELRLIVETRKALRETDPLLRLAVYGMFDNDWRAPSEREAMLWLTEEWNGDFVFRPSSDIEEAGSYISSVMNLT